MVNWMKNFFNLEKNNKLPWEILEYHDEKYIYENKNTILTEVEFNKEVLGKIIQIPNWKIKILEQSKYKKNTLLEFTMKSIHARIQLKEACEFTVDVYFYKNQNLKEKMNEFLKQNIGNSLLMYTEDIIEKTIEDFVKYINIDQKK